MQQLLLVAFPLPRLATKPWQALTIHGQADYNSRVLTNGIWVVQVALLQGLTDAAADQVAAASHSSAPNGTGKAQNWIKQQASSLAAQTSLPMVPILPKSDLMFLPDVMIRAAQQASPTTHAAAGGSDGGGGGGGQTGGGGGSGGVGGDPVDGVLVQADQQEASGRGEQCDPLAASTAERDQDLSSSNAQPVSWLEWEQQLQVTVFCPASLGSARSAYMVALYGRLLSITCVWIPQET